jgi:hypothetical protein
MSGVSGAVGGLDGGGRQRPGGSRLAYAVYSQRPGGFTANVRVTNLGDPVNGWSDNPAIATNATTSFDLTSGGTRSPPAAALSTEEAPPAGEGQ